MPNEFELLGCRNNTCLSNCCNQLRKDIKNTQKDIRTLAKIQYAILEKIMNPSRDIEYVDCDKDLYDILKRTEFLEEKK